MPDAIAYIRRDTDGVLYGMGSTDGARAAFASVPSGRPRRLVERDGDGAAERP